MELSGYVPKNGIAESYDSSIFIVLETSIQGFVVDVLIYFIHPAYEFLTPACSHIFIVCLTVAILTGER